MVVAAIKRWRAQQTPKTTATATAKGYGFERTERI
jgi:hypothetical protein